MIAHGNGWAETFSYRQYGMSLITAVENKVKEDSFSHRFVFFCLLMKYSGLESTSHGKVKQM